MNVEAQEPKPIYVLHGTDGFLRDQHRRALISRLVGQADPQTCVSVLDSSAELSAVLDELRTMPFLAPRRVVLVHDADAFVEAHRDSIERYLQSPASSGSLILMVSSWRSNTRLAKVVAKVGLAVDCSSPEGDMKGFVSQAAVRRGKKIQTQAAELLAEWVGNDLAALDQEIEKLSLYSGKRATITTEDVSALVADTAGPAVFDLTNAITDGQVEPALKALEGMTRRRGEEFKTLGMIAWHLRRVLQVQQAIRAGTPARKALPRIPPHRVEPFLAMLKRRPLRRLQLDFRRLIEADLAMKSGADGLAALQELVVNLCV